MKKRLVSLFVSFGLLAGLIYFSDIEKIISIFSRTNFFYVGLGLSIWFLGFVLRTIRWKYLLKRININTRFFDTMKVFAAGLFISNLTPMKAGDPIRSVLLKKVHGDKVGVSLSSVFMERIFDVIATVSLSLLGLFVLTSALSDISFWVYISISIYVGLFSFGIFILLSEKRIRKFTRIFFKILSFIPRIKKFEKKIEKFSLNLHKSFKNYKSKLLIFNTLMISLIVWILEGVILFLSFKALGLEVTLISTIIIVPIATLIAILTFLPGGLGSGEIITVMFFTALFPLTLAEVTATVLLGRLLSFWVYAIVGAFFLSTFKFKYKI